MDIEHIYGNLNLYKLTDEELYELGINCVKIITLGVHLIEHSGNGSGGGVLRNFDLDKYELSDLMVRSNKLLTRYTESDRRKYINLLDDTLFIFVVYNSTENGVKSYIKQNVYYELKDWVKITLNRSVRE